MSSNGGTYPPLVAHDPDNKGAIVVVVTYSLMFITIAFTILRTWASQSHNRELQWQDVAFFLAVLLLVVESILTERAVHYGLGQHISDVVASRLVKYYQYEYGAQILGILVEANAKFVVVLMVERIANELSTKKLSLALKGVIVLWTAFSVFTIAFQCGLPQPWEFTRDRCAVQGKLYYVVIAGDIVTDALLACYIIPTMMKLQMRWHLRVTVSSLFMLRLFVCAVSLGYVALMPNYLSSNDRTWDNVNVQILFQTVVNLSVVTAGIPNVGRYLSQMQTGRLAMVLDESEIEMTGYGSGAKRSRTEETAQSPIRPNWTAHTTTRITGGGEGGVPENQRAGEMRADAGRGRRNEGVTGDDESTSSLVKNAVFQQRDFDVRVEYDGWARI